MSIRSSFSNFLRSILRNSGREVVHYDVLHFPELYKQNLLQLRKITQVLDVGGNLGQTGEELREGGYRGKVASFEPLSKPFEVLAAKAKADGNWTAENYALGDAPRTAEINVSGFAASSSFLPMADRHTSIVPESAYTGTETVKIETLDSIFNQFVLPADRTMLKIDTQGYEMSVLLGARESLPKIDIVQLEVSTVLLYKGQPKYYEVMKFLDEAGFDLANIIPAFYDGKTAQFLQADAIFIRSK